MMTVGIWNDDNGQAMTPFPEGSNSRAWYHGAIDDFVSAGADEILGALTRNSEFGVDKTQKDAWLEEISFLRTNLEGLNGAVWLEFTIPRMGSRVDAVVVIGPVVLVIEFKIGQMSFGRSAVDQVWDYALDLKNFHAGSHCAAIVPILIATEARESEQPAGEADEDGVFRPMKLAPADFRETLLALLRNAKGADIDPDVWERSPYKPTPTIVEAARSLYSRHKVAAIACFDAGRQNLSRTSKKIEDIITGARKYGRKAICFVTGVPGAGKTLVGLNVATQHRQAGEPTHAVLLSGNGPLVAVLSAALMRDENARLKAEGRRRPKGCKPVKQFIQNVHHFRDESRKGTQPPADHVVVFDEAQRAWNKAQTAKFMKQKRGLPDFTRSEPEYLLDYVDRHKDWATVVCLVGGGQEINTGEAGIGAWLEAVGSSFLRWEVHISPQLADSEYSAARDIRALRQRMTVHEDADLHLGISMRSFRSERVSAFVKALLDCEMAEARAMLEELLRYPIVVTRNMTRAKSWIREKSRGNERSGVVASSKAQRLKPHAIDIRHKVDPVHWFLNDKEDTRSSCFLEDAATEFQVQGLEVDWAIVSWDADLRFQGGAWSYHAFRGSRWQNICSSANREYLKNAYRVLLTRARQGMVIFVPEGDAADATRSKAFYDGTFQYLVDIGIRVIDS